MITITSTTTVNGQPVSCDTLEPAQSFSAMKKQLKQLAAALEAQGWKLEPVTRVDFKARKVIACGAKLELIELLYEARYDDKKSRLVTDKANYVLA